MLISKLKILTGTDLPIQKGRLPDKTASEEAAIVLKTGKVAVNGVSAEAYNLNINQTGVTIVGSDAAGVFYGVQSLLQLAPTDAYIKNRWRFCWFGFVQVQDAPRFHFEHAPGCGRVTSRRRSLSNVFWICWLHTRSIISFFIRPRMKAGGS
jgi:hexosaminidase